MKNTIAISLFVLAAALCMKSHAGRVNVAELGVYPDSSKVQTALIQRAVDSACESGDTLLFGAGTYVTGTLRLPDNAHIVLERGALLAGSTNPYDYSGYAEGRKKVDGLLVARGSSNLYVSGPGCVDGRGLDVALAVDSLHHTGERPDPGYSYKRMRPSLRPKLIDFSGVDGLVIENISLRNSAAWGLSLDACENVLLSGIDFVNRAYWNNDGIDIADCRHVVVEKCDINSADDGIVLKSFDPESCNDDIVIRDCTIRSSASALKFGTESYGGFRNVKVRNIRVIDTFRSAVALETVDGAVVENVDIDGVVATNTGNAIFMRLGHRHGDALGSFRNVAVRNLRCEVPFGRADMEYDVRGPDINVIHNTFPSSLTGIPGARLQNVVLENIEISYPGRGTKAMGYVGKYRYASVPEAVDSYPEYHMFGELPAWGLYVSHVDGIKFENVVLKLREADYREAVVMEDVLGAEGEPQCVRPR